MVAVVFLHIPIGAYYIYHVIANNLTSGLDWLFGVIYFILAAFIGLYKSTYSWMANENSPYLFDDVEMKRFNVQEKLERLKRS